jgi:hypothetical protein
MGRCRYEVYGSLERMEWDDDFSTWVGLMMATSDELCFAALLHHHRQILDLGVCCRSPGAEKRARHTEGREGGGRDPLVHLIPFLSTRQSTPSTNDLLVTLYCSRRSGGIAHVYSFAPTIPSLVVVRLSVSKRSTRSSLSRKQANENSRRSKQLPLLLAGSHARKPVPSRTNDQPRPIDRPRFAQVQQKKERCKGFRKF